ncbi:MAG: hypothetical protein Q9160_007580 [Pyrenula sp. 1 TL-2023]
MASLTGVLFCCFIARVYTIPLQGAEPSPRPGIVPGPAPYLGVSPGKPQDTAPDGWKDNGGPFPPLQIPMPEGPPADTPVEKLQGYRFFGWDGCKSDQKDQIVETIQQFYNLADNAKLTNINWDSQAAKEIWGHSSDDRKAISNERKQQIQEIFKAVQQVRDRKWWFSPYPDYPPVLLWKDFWIRVTCSSKEGDPGNTCGDRPTKDTCYNSQKVLASRKSDVEAFSNPLDIYRKITFCHKFFEYPDLDAVIRNMKESKRNHGPDWNNLEKYQNRARVLFHEITHLDTLVRTPDPRPGIGDLQITYGSGRALTTEFAYGPENIKILANYEAAAKGGFYTQRNAESFAWFALAKRVEQEVGIYPNDPVVPNSRKPARTPRNGVGQLFADSGDNENDNNRDTTQYAETAPAGANANGKWMPGCRDHAPTESKQLLGESSFDPTNVSPTCDSNVNSNVPSKLFYDTSEGTDDKPGPKDVFTSFCLALDPTQSVGWTVNNVGELQGKPNHNIPRKRTPPVDPHQYDNVKFDLDWKPTGNQGCAQSGASCWHAFASIADSHCGRLGSGGNGLASKARLDIPNCGYYEMRFAETGPPKPPPEDLTDPQLGPPQCYDRNSIGEHPDPSEEDQAKRASVLCAKVYGTFLRAGQSTATMNIEGSKTVNPETGLEYEFNISWNEGCHMDAPVEGLNAGSPRPDIKCEDVMKKNYSSCKLLPHPLILTVLAPPQGPSSSLLLLPLRRIADRLTQISRR